ncbi:YncE family protein [Actinophytocola glycyrrhizae]|uniref:YncE family protein n=1 Tax=Actinophytocola glycyrrhizae TaxID=2044873 RepID=A0ABV9RTH7_9PSEU
MLRRKVAVLLVVCAAVGSGCSSERQGDELMVTDNPVAATAAVSPPAAATPAGAVTALTDDVVAMAFEPESGTLAVAGKDTLRLYPLADTLGDPRTVDVAAGSLTVEEGAFLAAGEHQVVRVAVDGGTSPAGSFRGEPAGTAPHDGRILVAMRDEHAVAVVEGAEVQRMISGDMMSVDQVLSTGEGAVVLDRLRNAVFELDVPGASVSQGLRAGQGATNAVTDRFGRVLVTDTRGGALLAFSLDPLLMRQNYPVAGAPYAIAYDAERDLAWVTLTERNEVVGYDVAGEEPEEKYRFPTVSQPNTVAVDPRTGRVMVASGTGDGIQVIAL